MGKLPLIHVKLCFDYAWRSREIRLYINLRRPRDGSGGRTYGVPSSGVPSSVRPAYSQIAYGKLFSEISELSNLVGLGLGFGLWLGFGLGLELVQGLGLG